MTIQNQTSVPILCAMDDRPAIQIEPGCQGVFLTESREGTLWVEHLYSSRLQPLFDIPEMRVIVLNSSVFLSEIEEAAECILTGELVHFQYGYTYDRFFCRCLHCCLGQQKLAATDSEEIRSSISVKEEKLSGFAKFVLFVVDFLFSLEYVWGALLLFILIKIAYWESFSWWWLPAFAAAGFVLYKLEDLAVFGIPGKRDRKKRESQRRSDLGKYMSDAYIQKYYSDGRRTWIGKDRTML